MCFVCLIFLVGMNAWKRWAQHFRHSRAISVQIWLAAVASVVYGVWRGRNRRIFTNQSLVVKQVASRIVRLLKSRIQALNVVGKTIKTSLELVVSLM